MPFELYLTFIVAFAFFLQRITGFGSAVVATPLLALLWDPHESIALVLIFQNVFGLWLIIRVWRRVLDRELRVFQLAFFPMVVAGAYLLPNLEAEFVRRALAAVCGLVMIQWLFVPSFRLKGRWKPAAGGLCGFLSGFVQGTLGMGGPLFLLYYGSVEGRADKIRDSTIAVFALANLLRAPIALATAQFTTGVMVAALYTTIPFAAAMFLGAGLSERLDSRMFRYIAVGILGVAAIQLLLN